MQNGRTPTAYDLLTNNHMELFKKIFVQKPKHRLTPVKNGTYIINPYVP